MVVRSPVVERLRTVIHGDRAEQLARAEARPVPPVVPGQPVQAARQLLSLRRRLSRLGAQLHALAESEPPRRREARRARLLERQAALAREAEYLAACLRCWLDS